MKIILNLIFILTFLFITNSFAQSLDTLIQETEFSSDTLTTDIQNDTLRLRIIDLIEQINAKSFSVDLLHSDNVVKFKATSLDETGNIEIKVKKPDDLWFRIWGSFAIISKDVFIAHFNRKNFIYFDNMNDKVIEGPSTDNNIGYIARIKCSFDDLVNTMSGTCKIVYSEKDSLFISNENNFTVISVKGKKFAKYWVEPNNLYVVKYAYLNKKQKEYLRISYTNFVKSGNGYFSRKVDITKPLTNEYIKIFNETYSLNNPSLNFKVDFPSDVRRIRW